MIDPNEFIITRKRKKYKFAKFANSSLCFEYDEWDKKPVDVVEIGAGTGLFSVEMASKYPDKTFVAVDIKGDRLQKGAYTAKDMNINNVFFLRARADQITELFEYGSVGEVWVTFPDPFLKKRSAGRRLTHPNFLHKYSNILKSDGMFYLKHDNEDFFQWSLEQLVSDSWVLDELSFDLHESELSDDYKIMTTYEKRWLGEGRKTNFVKAHKPTESN